ncbi:MAG: M36 family metallopeptidase [Verrucomicrobiae bacterium]|nr:M36 family metallopeptidase [Verrucomicrobiae bacterium]
MGWLSPGDTETRGNNVTAHTDRDGNNEPDLPRPTANNRVFDFPLDLNTSPTNSSAASVVNVFYWCNFAHDRFYELGFTESAGNFQQTNFNRGGLGGDPVIADVQDGEGFNNANFSTPPYDGMSPRMQMYIFNAPHPDRDGALDAEVILHEYTHGLSERLVGAGYGIVESQTAGMAEGWSDFMAMALLSHPQQSLASNYPFSAYVARMFGGILAENYYYGLRRYPYSTNLAVHPLTFKDIDPTQASFHFGVPRNPAIGTSASQVHNQGEVWCAVLWDMRANLIARHGFATGNWLAMQLVVDGMRNCPANPNFLHARDAILLADRISFQGANRAEIWAAFARRGMGAMASSPPSYTTIGIVEDFSLPEDFDISPTSEQTINGTVGGPFSPATLTFDLMNAGRAPLSWSASATPLLKLSATNGVLQPQSSTPLVVSLSAIVTELPAGTYTQQVFFANTATGSNQIRNLRLVIRQESSFLVEFFDHADFDLEFTTLTFTPDDSAAGFQVCRQPASAFPTDPAGGDRIFLGDDWYLPLTLTNGRTVSLFGQRTNIIYISSNGHLTTRMGNTQYFQPELSIFYEQPRVAALYADFHPGQSNLFTGTLDARVSWRQLDDRLAVTWQDVPEYGIQNSNSFQIELFYHGPIRITWLRMDARNGRTGLAPGRGVPTGLVETDFSSSPLCGRQLYLAVQNGLEGQGALPQAGRVSLPEPVTNDVEVTLLSENTAEIILPSSVLIPAGQTSQWFTVVYPDDPLVDGPRRTRLHASAPGFSPAQTLVTVLDNEIAQLDLSFPSILNEGAGLVATAGVLRVTPAPDEALIVRLSSLATNLAQIPEPGFVILGAGQQQVPVPVRILDNNLIEGLTAATLSARVEGWPPASANLLILDNEPRQLSLQVPARVGETFGTLTNAGRVSVAGPLTFDLVVLLQSSQPTRILVPPTLTIPSGQSQAFFNLQVLDDQLRNPTNTVLITASALGFTNATATLIIDDNETLAPPTLTFPAHQAAQLRAPLLLQWSADFGELLLNGGFETGDFTGWSNAPSPDGSAFILNHGSLLTAQGAGPFPPIAGRFEALSHPLSAGRRELSQWIQLPAIPGVLNLSWQHTIRNYAEGFNAQHQFRVELRDASGTNLLATLFSTQPGDPLMQSPVQRSANLNPWQGRKVLLAFVAEDSLGCLNVSVDNVSLALLPPEPVTFEVYLGLTTNLTATNLLGVTTNKSWLVPGPLSPLTTYFWQIVAVRGDERSPSPIRSFTTAGAAPPPQISFNLPGNYSTVTIPSNVLLNVTASAPAGVVKISFYDYDTKIGEVSSPPYTLNYLLGTAGLRQLRAILLDGNGQETVSPPLFLVARAAGAQPITFIPAGAPWRYLDNGSNQGSAWRQRDFDDSSWKIGRGRFGYGLGGETTLLDFGPDPDNKFVTTYFRTMFTNHADLSSLTLKLIADDGVVIWFNDLPIRINMPPLSDITYNDRAESEVTGPNQTNFVTYSLHPWILPQGPVLLAVELHQHTNNGPDLAFDLALEALGNYRPVVQLTAPPAGTLLPPGQPLALQVLAFDRYGQITRVEYFAHDTKLGEASSYPYSFIWTNPPPGTFPITAVATDNNGAASTSAPVWISFGGPALLPPTTRPGELLLSWPAAPPEYLLESASRLEPPDWQPLTNSPTVSNGLRQLLLPLDGPQRFFRLRRP